MKAFASAAVFGLVPVPPLPASQSCRAEAFCNDNEIGPDPAEPLEVPERGAATERMATKDELAHIRHELDVSAD